MAYDKVSLDKGSLNTIEWNYKNNTNWAKIRNEQRLNVNQKKNSSFSHRAPR